MALPLKPPIEPWLAKAAKELPEGEGWAYEPKWDGYRAIVFVDGDEVYLQSRGARDLGRYFPELEFPAGRYVVDGEVVVLGKDGREDFDALGQRIHPAESRIAKLAGETPAIVRSFDLLARDDEVLLKQPFAQRRAALEELIETPLELTPLVTEPKKTSKWMAEGEGVIAKRLDAPYRPGERLGMEKIKRLRTADCIVVGWREGKESGTVGSLALGLYDDAGKLRVVGHTSGFRAKEKRELPAKLAPFETGQLVAGEPSRWQKREPDMRVMRPELVVEVTFDHVSGGRIRHGAKILRWRSDRDSASCRIDQLDQ